MEYDVVVVGGGPAGLSTAIRLKQLAADHRVDVSVCLVEKAPEIGAHILSGAVIEPRALDELLPDWGSSGAPLQTAVRRDEFYFLTGGQNAVKMPNALVPRSMHNQGNLIVSLGELCRWLGEQAEQLDVDVFAGFAASDVVYDDRDAVAGIVTVDRGRSKAGVPKDTFEPGVELRARQTVLAEGARGHLGRALIEKYALAGACDPQHYAIGLKELWEVPPDRHDEGLVVHGAGWPLSGRASGGCFQYHLGDGLVALGLIVDLNYANPWLSPFEEFQRMKHHPLFANTLRDGKRIGFGARAITKGGLNALPKMSMPGALLVGCDAGTLNFGKIKGTHTAMKSGIVAAETIFAALQSGAAAGVELEEFGQAFEASWACEELRRVRSFGAALHKLGLYGGGVFNYLDQTLLGGRWPFSLRDRVPDHERLVPARKAARIVYPKPDGQLSFDRLSSVYLSGTTHDDDQPVHLTLKDPELPIAFNLPEFDAPEQRYCPAAVYEIVEEQGRQALRINAQNCVHCKTCDIKDPKQNIVWVPPESGGPVYSKM